MLHAVREHSLAHGLALQTVALHPARDRQALYVREAQMSVVLRTDLDVEAAMDEALVSCGADAAWALGPIARVVQEVCAKRGITWLGGSVSPGAADVDWLATAAGLPGRHDPDPHDRVLEAQVVVDGVGPGWVLGLRDTTLSRPGRQVLVESSCPCVSLEDEQAIRAHALRVAQVAGLHGVGTVRLLLDPRDGSLALRGLHPWLTEGHDVTEAVTGLDLALLQLELALGGTAPLEVPESFGHATGLAVHAEDPEQAFAPSPGRVALLRLPTGPGIRVDVGTAQGDVLPAHLDAQIARVVARGRSRAEALNRLRHALVDLLVVVEGGSTGKAFLMDLLEQPSVRDGTADRPWLEAFTDGERVPNEPHLDAALAVAAADAADLELATELVAFAARARRGKPIVQATLTHRVELRHRGLVHVVDVARAGPTRYRMRNAGVAVDVDIERVGPFESRVTFGGQSIRAVSSLHDSTHTVEIEGFAHRFSRAEVGVVRSPSPGVVAAIPVAVGDVVTPGSVVAVIESMKMESAVTAGTSGRVRRVHVGPNTQVPAGVPLVEIESDGDLVVSTGALLVPEARPTSARDRCAANHAVLRSLLLGFDVEPADVDAALADQQEVARLLEADPEGTLACDREVLEVFADIQVLFRDRPDEDDPDTARSSQEHIYAYMRSLDADAEALPRRFMDRLRAALRHYGVEDLAAGARLQEALYRVVCARDRAESQVRVVIAALERLSGRAAPEPELRTVLERVATAVGHRFPVIADLAREVRYRLFDEPVAEARRAAVSEAMANHLGALLDAARQDQREEHVAGLVACEFPLAPLLLRRLPHAGPAEAALVLEVLARRYYRVRQPEGFEPGEVAGHPAVRALYGDVETGGHVRLVAVGAPLSALADVVATVAATERVTGDNDSVVVDLLSWDATDDGDELAEEVRRTLDVAELPSQLRRVVVVAPRGQATEGMSSVEHLTMRWSPEGWTEDRFLRGLHPLMAARLRLSRLRNFDLTRLPTADDLYLFHATARANPKDERLFALCEVRDLTPVADEHGRVLALPELERALAGALAAIRQVQARRPPHERYQWNRIALHVWPPLLLPIEDIESLARRIAPSTAGLGLERIAVRCRRPDPVTGELRERVIWLSSPSGVGFTIEEVDQPAEPLRPLDEYTQKVVSARRRGTAYPYELIRMVAAPRAGGRVDVTGGRFVEHDLDDSGELVPVDRGPGRNTAAIVAGIVSTFTARHPEGMPRVVLLGDPTKALGSLAEPECRRIVAALDLAQRLGVPCEWFALSAGARIAMDSGTENMDWIAAVLRRIIEFTQAGAELNIVVTGINVGAQPYWNAEATMLMHTKGILVMTPESAMVLTGKQALDYSGGVSAEDNFGIGGFERVMGPNGQGQYWAPDLTNAIAVLLAHYDHCYVVPGERFPRRATSSDPVDRDVRTHPHHLDGSPFSTVGEILSAEVNPERKLPFDIRAVMRAVSDLDHEPLERWATMRDAEVAVTWDAHVGGYPVAMLGFESHTLSRGGAVPADGPDRWTSGTLFPLSSKKVARAINAASGNRPLIVVANLSGFDGSPDSMRSLQLEFGAEIGRAVVNFRGPIVFCVVSRYHGGAFVVFSGKLNDNMQVLAVEGSRASVIGGAPAAAVVFAGEVNARTRSDDRVLTLEAAASDASGAERARIRAELADVTAAVKAEKLGEVASEFDRIHSVERALAVGSVDAIVPARELRPRVVEALERGMARELALASASR